MPSWIANSTYIDWIGLLAACLTTFSFLPQVIKTWRSRSAEDFSWSYLLMFGSGIASWDLYGFLIKDTPIVLANSVTLALFMLIVAAKIRFRSKL